MAKCVRCGRSGIGLKVDASGLCPDCQTASRLAQENQIREMKAELEMLRKFRDEYIVIPNAKDEADRILSAANRQADEMRQEAEQMKAATKLEIEAKLSNANLKLAQVQSDSSAAVAAAEAQIAALLASAAKDFVHFGKTSVANASASEAKARARASVATSASFTSLTPSAFRRAAAKGFVVFDLETTGLSPVKDRILEIGAIKYDASRTEVNRFNTLIDPEKHIPASATAINNITDDMVDGAPKLSEVLPRFVEFVGSLPIIAHNAEFDVSFLRQAMTSCSTDCTISYGDSLVMARKAYALPNYRLETIADHLNVRRGQAHRSLGDCETLGAIVFDLLDC